MPDDARQEGLSPRRVLCYHIPMTDKEPSISISANESMRSAKKDMQALLEMFEFFLTERQLGKPIETLGESVRDMRIIIGRLLVDHFLRLEREEEERFCSALASMLADRAAELPVEEEVDQEYCDYCVGEILTAFEYAQEIKGAYPSDSVMQKILALDIPILRPFDYGMRGKMKLVPAEAKKRVKHKT